MPIYFLDSSALVKAYRQEPGTPRVINLLNGVDPLVISGLAHPEVSAAIVRRGLSAGIPLPDLDVVLGELELDIANTLDVIDLTPPVITRAVELTRDHGLRGADAVQLACALSARDRAPGQRVVLVGSDKELNAAALAEGLATMDPNHP